MGQRPLIAIAVAAVLLAGSAGAQAPGAEIGQEEFGLTERQLSQNVERVEALIASCMRAQGFEYVAVDFQTVRRSMLADKVLPGMEEEQFIAKYGFGISTMYTGAPPQLATGYSPGKMGLGRRNVEIFKSLSPADQVAYSRALSGENSSATFALGLEAEDFSRCGGCTREAIEEVFDPEMLEEGYYNPLDALIASDPRMREALREYQNQMRAAGYDAENPDVVEFLVIDRLDAITAGSTIPVEHLSQEQLMALEQLQDYERGLAIKNLEIEEEVIEPVEEQVEQELYARRIK